MTERRLYIGAPMRCSGWEVYDTVAHPDVDHVGPFDRMPFPDASFTILYANAAGRLDPYVDALAAMHEWARILAPGGALICVCLDSGAAGGAMSTANFDDQILLGRLLGQQRGCWTSETLCAYLQVAGFKTVRRAASAGLFNDISELAVDGRRVGLSLLASRP